MKQHPEFPLADDILYLNHAAVAPWPKRSRDAVTAFCTENSYYGARHYTTWLKQEARLRRQFQTLINAASVDDIALVKNTSEALSFVAYGLDWQAGDNIVSCQEEFPSNRIPWQSLSRQGVEFREAELQRANSPESALLQLVDRRTRLLTVSSVQFASGLRLNLEQLGAFCHAHDILFCVDAIQQLGALQFDAQACQADFVMADGHKWLLGPEGLGVFYSTPAARERLQLTQYGWHMIEQLGQYENRPWEIAQSARRFEPGSPNMLGIHALSASLSLLLETGMPHVEQNILARTAYLTEHLASMPSVQVLSCQQKSRQSGITLFRPKMTEPEALFQYLEQNGVVCALRGGGVRFSPHFYTQEPILEQALGQVRDCLNLKA